MKFFRNSYRLVPHDPGSNWYAGEYRQWWSPIWWYISKSMGDEAHARKACLIHSGARSISLGKLP